MIKVAIVDDHRLFLESFVMLLRDLSVLEVWGSFESAEDLIRKLNLNDNDLPDIVLLDLKLKGMSGFKFMEWLKETKLDLRVIIISMFNQNPFIRRAVELGAMGFISKESDSREIEKAVLSTHNVGCYLPESLSRQMVSQIHEKQGTGVLLNAKSLLTRTELEVLGLIAQGLTAHQIGAKLNKSPRTIEGHKQRLFYKTQQNNTTALAVWAFRQGLIL